MIQYNKLYQSLKKISAEWHAANVLCEYSWNYIKFYQDGTVIFTSSSDEPSAMGWFKIDNEEVRYSKGNFSLERNRKLEIEIPVAMGTLRIDGVVGGDKLILRSSNIEMNLIESWDEYSIADVLV